MLATNNRRATRVLVTVLVIIALFSAREATARTTATYTGANNGTYNDPANWHVGVVPINGRLDTHNVFIPVSRAVDFDLAGLSAIIGLNGHGAIRTPADSLPSIGTSLAIDSGQTILMNTP